MQVLKRANYLAPFEPKKLRKWISWGARKSEYREDMEYNLFNKLVPVLVDGVSTVEINQTLIRLCLEEEDIEYSRLASEIERAMIFKNQEHALGIYQPESVDYGDFVEAMHLKGLYDGDWIDEVWYNEELVNEWYIELEALSLEYWTVKQWVEKYSIKIDGEPVETPAQGALAIALALHGVTDIAFELAKDMCTYKTNLPTPVMNGCRDGNFDTISCSVIESGDTVESLEVASHLSSIMTAKKAGIGVTLDTRSKGDKVKGGKVTHLGKHPLFRDIETAVKKFTQLSRGGSATITIKALDPDIMSMLKWKTQRIDLAQRIDKVDYSFAYNDTFIDALFYSRPWYLFSKADAPEVHEAYHSDDYEEVVKQALLDGKKHIKVDPMDVLLEFAKSRTETSRLYCVNLTRMNDHTPFDTSNPDNVIKQSNLCMEIALPTTPFESMFDIYDRDASFSFKYRNGEIAYCSLAALNVVNIDEEEYYDVAYRALLTVTMMIKKAADYALSPYVAWLLTKRMSVGIGITGLAGKLYKDGLDFDGSPESIDAVEFISELHYYSLLKASQAICAEGISPAVEGIKQDWLPIDTMHSYRQPVLDWEVLRGLPRAHSVLVAHMPTESSSLFSNATNSVYPCREKIMYKKARQGAVQFIAEHFVPGKHLTAWDVDMVPYYQSIGNFTDQAISADSWVDFTKYPNKKYPFSDFVRWFMRQAEAGIKTAYYQNNIDSRGEHVELEETCTDGGCKL